ncbi:MAG: hypothetical protein D6794_05085 [Deltaproteobacteria bacterium]|nr:MAG: hypothetical protein D6794_05085 [Deltaproteobacteria bacterium]
MTELPPDFTGYRQVEVRWTDFELPATCTYPFFRVSVYLNGNTAQGQCVRTATLNPVLAPNVDTFDVSDERIFLVMNNLETLNLNGDVSLFTIHFAGMPGSTVEVAFGPPPYGFYASCATGGSSGIYEPEADSPLNVYFPALEVSGAIYKAPFTQSNCGNGVDAGIPGVEVYLSTGPSCPPAHAEQSTLTDNMGSYAFSAHSLFDYGLFPYKDNNADCGVNTLDYYLVYYHLLGLNLLDYPYQVVAGDMDLNRTLTIGDVVDIIRLINGTFVPPDRWYSWTFMPSWVYANFPSVTSQYYSYPEYDEYITLYNLATDAVNQDFTGIKRADVDGSCSDCNAESGGAVIADRSETRRVELHLPDMRVGAGERVGVPVYLSSLDEPLAALAFALEVAPDQFEVEGIGPGLLEFADVSMVNVEAMAEGMVRLAWLDMDDVRPVARKDEPLCYVWLRAVAPQASVSDAVRLRPDIQDCSLVTLSGERYLLSARTLTDVVAGTVQVRPNPVRRGEELIFSMPEGASGTVVLELFDVQGRPLGQWKQAASAGSFALRLPTEGLPAGWLAWRLQTGSAAHTGKILVVK